MSVSEPYDVVIVGAGPVGSTAANLAARHGLRTLLVDKSTEVFPKPRAIHFDADIMRIFQFAGLAERIEPIARATTGGVHLGMDGEPIRQFRVPDEPGDLGWRPHYMFSQPRLDGLLREAAAERPEVDVLLDWRGREVRADGDEVVVVLQGADGADREVRGRYVIGADGAASETRKGLGIELSDYGFEEPWVIMDLEVPDERQGPDHTIMYCDPARPGTYVPGPDRHRRWEFMLLPGETDEELSTPEAVRELVAPVTPWLDVETARIVRVAVYRFHALVAARWSDGRVFLAGDAAHQTPPFYGQGMCHGIRDVRNLLWKIAAVRNGRAPEGLLASYQAEREPHVRAIIEAAVANGRYICTLDPELAEKRDRELRKGMAEGTDARSFREVIPGLQEGLLDREPGSEGVGLLFVQPHVTLPDGTRTLLDDVLGDEWAVVTATGINVDAAVAEAIERRGMRLVRAGREVIEVDGSLQAWFATFECEAAIVRPDRYVFGTAASSDDLVAALERLDSVVPLRPMTSTI